MATLPVSLSQRRMVVDRGRRRDEQGDEEEEIVQAALERLSTYNRMRRTIVQRAEGTDAQEVGGTLQIAKDDLKDVDGSQYLANEIFKLNNPEEDSQNFLSKLRRRIDAVGVELPTVEVRYENVKIEGQIYQGRRAIPTLTNTVLNFIEVLVVADTYCDECIEPRAQIQNLLDFTQTTISSLGIFTIKKRKLTILEGVTGTIKPARMTLLLGPPASGKSTFLLALAGQLQSNLKVEGKIVYNGYSLDEFEPRKTAAYVSQNDTHAPDFTVRETMDFSARLQGVGSRFDLASELIRREEARGVHPDPETDYFLKATALEDTSHNLITEYYMKILGLDICANTIVGDQMRRGISGGQRKRLTTGEMIVGPSRVLFMDEISTGLDSSTAFQVLKCISQAVHILELTTVISLLQPAPETYELFDDVIVFSGGHVVYHGPLEHVQEFFQTCGFKCPSRKAIPDFLQEVTSIKDQEQYWADKSKPYKFVPVMEFVDAYKNFHVWQKMNQEMAIPLDKSTSHPKALVFDRWSHPQWQIFKIILDREILNYKKNSAIPLFNMIMLCLLSTLTASLFFRTEMDHRNFNDAQHYNGALFYLFTSVVFLGYSEVTFTAIRFPVFHKLREIYFFPPWTWALSLFIIKVPFAIVETFLCLALTYYVVGFAPQASRFFRLWLLLALSDQMASGLFRMIAGISRTYAIAISVGGFVLTSVLQLGGYVIPRNSIKKYWIWGYWVAPLSYIQNAVTSNEFLAPRWRKDLPNDQHTLGHRFILSVDMFDRGFFFWLACGAVVGYILAFYIIFAWVITYLGIPGKSQPHISEEQIADQNAQRTGEGLDLIYRSTPSRMSFGKRGRSPSMSPPIEDVNSSTARDENVSAPGLQMTEDPTGASASFSRSPHYHSDLSYTSRRSGNETAKPEAGMILPFQPLAISFKNINYFIDMPSGVPMEKRQDGRGKDKLQLLQEITGSFRPGVLTALVGVTGAGKSTLMDVLAGRKTKGYIEGDIRISGFPKKQETFARISGYCEQNDIHSPQVTLHESLIFSAWLRLSSEIDNDMKMKFVQEVMDLVELTPLKHSIVGVPGESGLSTQQRKRLTIAVELVANPSIVFMDEPTSGLDARAAATVMRVVRNTVDTGRTVVCTIHQPSIDIFNSFDELLLLSTSGQLIYAGPLGTHAQKVIDYFQAINGVPKIKEGSNPATWMLEITTPGVEEKLKVNFAQIYKSSSAYEETNDLVEELSKPLPGTKDLWFPTVYAQPPWKQFTCCLWKQYWAYWRNPSYNLLRLLLSVTIGLQSGSLFWGMGKKISSERNVYSILAVIYTSQVFYGVAVGTAVQPVIDAERTIFYRERSAGMYSELPYAIAQCVVEVPYVMTSTSIYCLLTYSMMKLKWEAKKFFYYLFFFFCSQIWYVYWGMFTVAVTPNPQFAAIIANVIVNIWNLFSGFVVPHPQFPRWWKWISWTNPLAYNVYGTIVSQFGDLSDTYATTQSGSRVSVKELIRTRYGYRHSYLGFVTAMTAAFPFAFAVLFILSIKYLNYQQR